MTLEGRCEYFGEDASANREFKRRFPDRVRRTA